MKKWAVAILAIVLAVSTLTGVAAQEAPPEPETANVDVTVWRLVSNPSLLYVSTRPEGGSWRTLNTPLDMSALSSSGNFHQSNAVRVRVPLTGGGAANVDVTVWRLVSNPSLLYVSTRPEGGSWRTVNTPLDMSALSSSGNFHQSNAVRVEVPLAAPPPYTCGAASPLTRPSTVPWQQRMLSWSELSLQHAHNTWTSLATITFTTKHPSASRLAVGTQGWCRFSSMPVPILTHGSLPTSG